MPAVAVLLICDAVASQESMDPMQPSLDSEPLLSIESPLGPIEYRAGRGMHFGWTGLNVGGFSTVEFEDLEGEPGELALDNLNFLVLLQPVERLRGFMELEVDGLATWTMNSEGFDSDVSNKIERLFGDVIVDDALVARLGKFQTPVGRWNLTPAEPFVWTPQEPVAEETAFDEHQTGGALMGSFFPSGGTLQYWVYGQFMGPLDKDESPEPAHRSWGARLQYDRDLAGWSVGSSYLATELDGEWSYLVGLDAQFELGPLEVTSEFLYEDGEIPGRDLWSIWGQGVLEVLPKFYLVGRVERFVRLGPGGNAVVGDVGAAWIPVPWLHLKAAYRLSDHETEDVMRGVKATISVLF